MWNRVQLELVAAEFTKAYQDKTGKRYNDLNWLLKNHKHVDYNMFTNLLQELGYDPLADSTSRYLAASDIIDQHTFRFTEGINKIVSSTERNKKSNNYVRNENLTLGAWLLGFIGAAGTVTLICMSQVTEGSKDNKVLQSAALDYSSHVDTDKTVTNKGDYLLSLKGKGYASNGDQKGTFEEQILTIQTPIPQQVKVKVQYDEKNSNKYEILNLEVKEGQPPTMIVPIDKTVVSAEWMER
jgi:hypothetical protein